MMLAGTQHRRWGARDTGLYKGAVYTRIGPSRDCPNTCVQQQATTSVCCFPHVPALPNVGIAAKDDT